eukprot:6460269-Amphidinium_carterae.2
MADKQASKPDVQVAYHKMQVESGVSFTLTRSQHILFQPVAEDYEEEEDEETKGEGQVEAKRNKRKEAQARMQQLRVVMESNIV